MTYSIDKCVKLVGYEYDLPDEVILKIQKIITKDNMKYCVNQFNDKYLKFVMKRNRGLERAMRYSGLSSYGIAPLYEYPSEDGYNRSCNDTRFLLEPKHNSLTFINPEDRYLLNICGMKTMSVRIEWVKSSEVDINMNKIEMVEHMKNNGMKFNKSKTKPELFHIYINHKNFIEEEPFVYTYKNIKKINYD